MATMVKAEVDDKANSFIEDFQADTDLNKSETVAYLREEMSRAEAFQKELRARRNIQE